MNQVQLYFLLFLTRAFIPLDIETVITGNTVTLNLPQYFDFQKTDFYSLIFDNFNFDLTNKEYDLLDVQSDSTAYNIGPTIILGVIIIILHIFVFLIYKLLSMFSEENRWSLLLKYAKLVLNKSLNILTFGYYIRYILEMNQFILISSVHEVYSFNSDNTLNIVSLVFAILMLVSCLLLILLVTYLSLTSYEVDEDKHNKLGEIFSGVKMQKKHKFYVVALLIRRTVFIVILITSESISSRATIGVLSGLQLGYLIFLAFIRPFEEFKCNAIEIMNEIYFLFLLSSLIYLNTEDNWNQSITNSYIFFLTSNTIVAFLIVFGKI